MAVISSLQFVNLGSYSISDELALDLETVANSNCGLQSVVLFKYEIQKINKNLSKSISKLIVNKLCINEHFFSESEAFSLALFIHNSKSICHLDLAYSNIPDSIKPMIAKAMVKHNKLTHLNLNLFAMLNTVESEITLLIERNTELQHLEIAGCELSEVFLASLSKALFTHHKLQKLNISYNTLASTAALVELCDILSRIATLSSLEMACCGLKDATFLSVIKTLTTLDLSNNPISDLHANVVATVIANNLNLKTVNISYCNLKSSGLLKITKVLAGTNKLQYLNLSSNYPTDQLKSVGTSIAAVIANNKDIRYLYLPNCVFQDITKIPDYHCCIVI